jgi:uroporphyrinogen-III synthase
MMLIVTRPLIDAAPLKRKLEARGHQVRLAPLLTIADSATAIIPATEYQAVLVTSANGARALSRHEARARIIGLPVVTVGSQSAEAARQAGFRDIHHSGGNVAQLIAHVRKEHSPANGPLLYLSGEEISGDLAGELRRTGYRVDRVALYAARPALRLPRATGEAIRNRQAGGVLLYSPRTARIWAKCVAAGNLIPYMKALLHYCLSSQVAEALPNDWPTVTATTADEDAMLERIGEAVQGGR